MEDLGMQLPKPQVDLEVIRREYHQATEEGNSRKTRSKSKAGDTGAEEKKQNGKGKKNKKKK
jgi:hypothetical protein